MIKAAVMATVTAGALVLLAFASGGGAANAGPVDTDGDGCPDASEQQTAQGSELGGGRRDFQNPWDYFNPSGDGMNRVDDIIDVLTLYGLDDDDTGYTDAVDRSFIGPEAWDLGAPDDRIRSDDVLAIVKQYFHDC